MSEKIGNVTFHSDEEETVTNRDVVVIEQDNDNARDLDT